MTRKVLLLCVSALLTSFALAQPKKTVLSAEIYDYQNDMVYFDCAQTPLIRAEFHTNPGEEHLYSFETDQITTLFINRRTAVLLMPGDSLHVNIRYNGKAVQSVAFSGTEQAVAQNQLYRSLDNLKSDMRYKSQLLTCIALDTKPKDRLADSRTLLSRAKELIANAKGIAPDVTAYIQAEIDADVYNSFMEYPMMYAETRRVPIEKQEIGDYWTLMDGYQIRSDKPALRCPEYVSLLMRYDFYTHEKKAHDTHTGYTRPDRLESMFAEFANTYEGEVRDAVLFTLLCNFIRNGKEIERVDPLVKEYEAKYNQDKGYMQVLNALLQ